jgi:tetratricopeptide (TPR) repeat protein
MEDLFAERLEDHLTELAHHFDHSGNAPKAVDYLGRTGIRAAQQGAHSEAIGYFTRALELLQQLPDGTARDRQELDLQMALSWSSFVARGPRAPERESALLRACDLCEHLRDNAKLMQALVALAHLRFNWNDLEPARELAERVVAMGQAAEASAALAGAHNLLGFDRFGTGQLAAARYHFERAIELFGAGPSDYYGAYFAQNAGNVLVGVLLILGYPSIALSKADALLSTARRGSDANSIATHLFSYGIHHLLLRETRMVVERADELLSIAIEHEMRMNLMAATFFRGWAAAAAGRGEEGIAEMRRSISDQMVGGAVSTSLMLVGLAETCGKHGRAQEGLDWVARGLATAEQIGHRVIEAELYRLKGELLLIKGPGNLVKAERCLRTAIDVARRQGARFFELRATVSLARLLRDTDRRDEARAMLSDIYNWFSEGFDTADLKDAKVLLDQLAA